MPVLLVTHPRTTIRDKFLSLLSGQTHAGTRIYDSRTQPVSTLPALRIFTRDDEFIEWRSLGHAAHRKVEVSIECLVSDNDESDAADACDVLCRQVEVRLNDFPDIDGTALARTYNSTNIEFNNDTDPPVVMGSVVFDVEYLDDFSS
tara:strand:- start:1829 stop:2269 length:441 start_codon:yes stop_codon:yes gene_type:complete